MEIGYKLSSEEHSGPDLVRYARRAEEVGFSFAAISDHFHPWIDKQGHSPFVWSVLGAIANATERLRLLTAVTCPTIRTHPAVIAQAAATTAQLMPGRFALGVGSGENLNEHILGDRWPPAAIRLEMLEEAVEVIRLLWEGGVKSHHGKHYTVENARIYDLPDEPTPILVAAAGERAMELAGRIGDGLVGVAPSSETVERFRKAGGDGKPTYAEASVCWATSEDAARKTAHRWWPNSGMPGELGQELRTPAHFEQASELVSVEDVAGSIPCGPDPDKHIQSLEKYAAAGFERVFVHQIGPDQDGFFDFYESEVLPRFS